MTNKHHLALAIFIILSSVSFDGLAQKNFLSDLSFKMYGGGSFLPSKPNEIESSYYEEISLGYNFGSEIIGFIDNVGLGLCYDQSHFSANDRTLQNRSIDENYRLQFFGPLLASRVKINKEHQLIFSVSYGKSISVNNATIDGDMVRISHDDWVPRFSFNYEYHFSDFSISASVQFINENKPSKPYLWSTQSNYGFYGNPTTTHYSYSSGIDLDRLSLNVGVSYHLDVLIP